MVPRPDSSDLAIPHGALEPRSEGPRVSLYNIFLSMQLTDKSHVPPVDVRTHPSLAPAAKRLPFHRLSWTSSRC
jgi:hypothetical protein